MQRLTLTGRLLITALILGGIYGAYKLFGGEALLKKAAAQTEQPANTTATETTASDTETEASNSSSKDSEATDNGSQAFSYAAPTPVAGKLKGVVELGASGFNSFIIRVDGDKNWRLEKSEFGNSLVTENMATDDDVRLGLKKYIGTMLDYGVGGRDIHFVVSSGAIKADGTQKIMRALKALGYFVNTVTPEQEGALALKTVLPKDFQDEAYVVDIGSGNTKISWKEGSKILALEGYGAKYFQNNVSDETVYQDTKAKATQIPSDHRKKCFIMGGVPFELAKQVRNGKERYTVLKAYSGYAPDNAKGKAGVNIYKAIAETTGTEQFIFDWDANFTIGFLLDTK